MGSYYKPIHACDLNGCPLWLKPEMGLLLCSSPSSGPLPPGFSASRQCGTGSLHALAGTAVSSAPGEHRSLLWEPVGRRVLLSAGQ